MATPDGRMQDGAGPNYVPMIHPPVACLRASGHPIDVRKVVLMVGALSSHCPRLSACQTTCQIFFSLTSMATLDAKILHAHHFSIKCMEIIHFEEEISAVKEYTENALAQPDRLPSLAPSSINMSASETNLNPLPEQHPSVTFSVANDGDSRPHKQRKVQEGPPENTTAKPALKRESRKKNRSKWLRNGRVGQRNWHEDRSVPRHMALARIDSAC